MSWQVLNHILGLASVDQLFWNDLKKDPVAACKQRGFSLTPREEAALQNIQAETLAEFSQRLLDELGNQHN